jgi:TonB family protein
MKKSPSDPLCSRKIPLAASICLAMWVVVGCATKRGTDVAEPAGQITSYASNGDVKAEVIDAPEQARYKATEGVIFVNPEPSSKNAVPNYPPELLIKRLDSVEVVVRVIVSTAGAVESAKIAHNSSAEQAFANETLAAVKRWTFSPLQRIDSASSQPLPFSQEYRFTFKQVDGRAVVSSGAGR